MKASRSSEAEPNCQTKAACLHLVRPCLVQDPPKWRRWREGPPWCNQQDLIAGKSIFLRNHTNHRPKMNARFCLKSASRPLTGRSLPLKCDPLVIQLVKGGNTYTLTTTSCQSTSTVTLQTPQPHYCRRQNLLQLLIQLLEWRNKTSLQPPDTSLNNSLKCSI